MINVTLLVLLTLLSCTSQPTTEYRSVGGPVVHLKAFTPSTRYLSSTDIQKAFMDLSDAKEQAGGLNASGRQRISELSPDILFISNAQRGELYRNSTKMRTESINKSNSAKRKIDRRSCDTLIEEQCGGTCTSHAITNAMDNFICNPSVQISSNQDLWAKYQKYSTWDGIEAASKNPICEESDWPNCGKEKPSCSTNRHIQLKSYQYLANDIEAIKSALDAGQPVVYSGKVTTSWVNCDAVIDPKSPASFDGGHAVAVVGYVDEPSVLGGGYLILRNSWGKICGDQGYQYLPYNYLTRTDKPMYGFAHSIKAVQSKKVPDPIKPSNLVKECYRCWKCLKAWECCCKEVQK